MRLSRIWRILQIKEGVIHRGRRPRWITPSEICRILHIIRKPNSIIALLFIQNVSPFLTEGVSPFRTLFFHLPNITQPCPQVVSVNSSIICSGLHFWRHFGIIGSITELQLAALWKSLVQYLVNSSCLWWIMPTCVVLTNLKTGKYFECWLVGCKRNVQNLISTFISSVVSQ